MIPNSTVNISSSKSGDWRFLKLNKRDMLELYPGALQDVFTPKRKRLKPYRREYEADEIEVLYWVNEAVIYLEEATLIVEECLRRYKEEAGKQAKGSSYLLFPS